MDKLKYVLIGAGNRGGNYSKYGYEQDRFELVGVAEPDDFIRNYFREKYNIPAENCFRSYEELLAKDKFADFAMITTQDKMHFAPTMMAIEKGYDLLLEKPVAPTPEECFAIAEAAEAKGVKALVCHVLRYTPFARKVKEIIDSGKLGKICSVVHTECVGNIHYSHSFVRGNCAIVNSLPICCWQNPATISTFCNGFWAANARKCNPSADRVILLRRIVLPEHPSAALRDVLHPVIALMMR